MFRNEERMSSAFLAVFLPESLPEFASMLAQEPMCERSLFCLLRHWRGGVCLIGSDSECILGIGHLCRKLARLFPLKSVKVDHYPIIYILHTHIASTCDPGFDSFSSIHETPCLCFIDFKEIPGYFSNLGFDIRKLLFFILREGSKHETPRNLFYVGCKSIVKMSGLVTCCQGYFMEFREESATKL
jgi:hypothetical protein